MVRGHSLAQDTRCPAVGKRLISSPISAMTTCAANGPIPAISSRRCEADSRKHSALMISASGWCGYGGQPGSAGQRVGQRVDLVEAVFGGGGEVAEDGVAVLGAGDA